MSTVQSSQSMTDAVIEEVQQQINEELRNRAVSNLPITQDFLDKLYLICAQRLRNGHGRNLAQATVAMRNAQREAEVTSSTLVSPSLRKEVVSET